MAISIFDSLGTGSAVGWVVHWTLGGFLLSLAWRRDSTPQTKLQSIRKEPPSSYVLSSMRDNISIISTIDEE